MLFSPHWADPVRHALIDPVLLSRALAERKDKLVLLEGTPEPDRPHILRFMEREDPGEYLHLSDDAFMEVYQLPEAGYKGTGKGSDGIYH